MYQCNICLKEFEKVHSLAAHKSHCNRKDTPEYKAIQKRRSELAHIAQTKIAELKKEERLDRFRICEKCQYKFTFKEKNMCHTDSGRFCSKSCSKSFSATKTPEINKKISLKLKGRVGFISEATKKLLSEKMKGNRNGAAKNRKNEKVKFKNCIECNREFGSSYDMKIFCSNDCRKLNFKKNPPDPEIGKKKRGERMKKQYQNGTRIPTGGKTKWYEIQTSNGVIKVQGSYEVRCCKILDIMRELKQIKNWEYTNDRIKYEFQNSDHSYILDFKVFNNDESFYYIETKGYATEKDFAKWNAAKQQNLDLRIWYDKELEFEENKLRSIRDLNPWSPK